MSERAPDSEHLPEKLRQAPKSTIDWPRLATQIEEPFSLYVTSGPRGHGPVAHDELLKDAACYCAEGGSINAERVLGQ